MDLQLAFRFSIIFSSQFRHHFSYKPLEAKKNKNDKGSFEILVVLSFGKYSCNLKSNVRKHSFITRKTIDIILFQLRLHQQQHSCYKIVVAILYKVVEPNFCRIRCSFQMVLLHQLVQ
jgi:hypothetical protein